MLSALQHLKDTMPSWFSASYLESGKIVGTARVEDDGAVAPVSFELTIEGSGDAIAVSETEIGSTLPAACPDRHINADGSFCTGLNYAHLVRNEATAQTWWEALRHFLSLQEVAKRTGRWPPGQELDHGDAGAHQYAALEAAQELGLLDEYRDTRYGQKSWMTSPWPRTDRDGTRLLNGRAPCPVGCRRKDGTQKLRVECDDGPAVVKLLVSERLRAEKLAEFWAQARRERPFTCCGTLPDCPMRTFDLPEPPNTVPPVHLSEVL